MRLPFLLCSLVSFMLANDITAEIKKESIPISSNTIEQVPSSTVATLQDRLSNDISFFQNTNNHNENTVSFRGVSNRATGYIEDLVPMYRTSNGYVNTFTIFTDSVLVANMGSSPSSIGVSSMGGDINIIDNKPSKVLEGKAGISVGNDGTKSSFYVGSKLKNYFIWLNGSKIYRDSYKLSDNFPTTAEQSSRERINSDYKRDELSLKVGYQINEADDIAFKVETNRGSHGIEPNVFDNNGGMGYQRINRKDLDSYYFYFNHKTSAVEANLRIYRDNYKDVYDFYTDNKYSKLLFDSSLYDDSRTGVLGKISFATNENNKISYVVNVENNEHIWRVDGATNNPRFLYQTIKNSLIDEMRFGNNFKLDGALTYASFRPLKISDTSNPVAAKFSSLDGQIKGSYSFDSSAIYASLAKTSRAPSMSEMFTFFPWDLPNEALKPESALQYEIGYKYFFEKDSTIIVDAFRYDIKNKIVYNSNMYQNLDKAIHEGVEFRCSNKYFHNHSFDFNYAYTYTKDSNGNPIELVPRQKASIADKINISRELSTQAILRYNDKMKGAYNSAYYDIAPYLTTDASLDYETKNGAVVTLSVKNIFDRNYYTNYAYPAEGRSVTLGASMRF